MRSIKLMLLGILVALLGLILSKQTIEAFFFRNLGFIPTSIFTSVLLFRDQMESPSTQDAVQHLNSLGSSDLP